ncbi:hypothetical protein BVH74_05955 [Halopseudomonas phragmitis]|uniref:protein-glutamate methylesterase n=2 Tax=Pseudomonadaceae TaxID=135621 RepID=A0A1V0B305_9GAMM|nr:hypothetical protein BVH74_05955 [Halopseudomonas phragmitis]RHW21269.1 chemotaxis protein CheB [Pseudomonas jilinensis]
MIISANPIRKRNCSNGSKRWSPNVADSAGRIALLVSQERRRQHLYQSLSSFGYQVVFAEPPAQLARRALQQVATDAWLVELADESPLADWLLEYSQVPVLFGAGEIPESDSDDYRRWLRRLYGKLLPLLGPPPGGTPACLSMLPTAPVGDNARCVWVLGASLGGPAAVKSFLDALPADLPIAFIYAQHIDPAFEQQLPQILGRHNRWRIINCRQGARLHDGEVLVAPIGRRLRFGPGGHLRLLDEPWPGPYQPSIEALLDEVAASFSPACGAIIFSGMGEDGVAACGRLRQQGVEVWTQSAETAACATMPGAVQQAGFSHFHGSPVELASALQRWLQQEWPLAL